MTANTPPAAVSSPRNDQTRLDMLVDLRDGHAVCCVREYLRGDIPMPSLGLFTAADTKLEDFQASLVLAKRRLA